MGTGFCASSCVAAVHSADADVSDRSDAHAGIRMALADRAEMSHRNIVFAIGVGRGSPGFISSVVRLRFGRGSSAALGPEQSQACPVFAAPAPFERSRAEPTLPALELSMGFLPGTAGLRPA